jgi:glyoxylase-like metal-dependent hydrolase (beta-lactamase superfamily II)
MFLRQISEILIYFYSMLVVKSFTFSPVQENTYIVYNEEKRSCVVDPGCYFENERRELENYLKENQLVPNYLLNTHCHLDHVFGNRFVYEKYGTVLHIHEREKQLLEYAPLSGQQWNLPFLNYEGDLIFLKEGEIIKLGADELKVIFLPGHSPGHVGFYCEKQQFILSGDVLFRKSIGRTDLPGGNYNTLIQSIRQKLFLLPDDVVVYSGHGEPTTLGYEKKHNPFLAEN